MKNLKQLQPILAAIHCINQTSEHKDENIYKLLEYAFIHILEGTLDILSLYCIGKTKEEIMPEIDEMLKSETKYHEFIERRYK